MGAHDGRHRPGGSWRLALVVLTGLDAGVGDALAAFLRLDGLDVRCAGAPHALDRMLAHLMPALVVAQADPSGIQGIRAAYLGPLLALGARDEQEARARLAAGASDVLRAGAAPEEVAAHGRRLLGARG